MDVAVEAANDSRMLVRGSIAGKGRQTRAAAGIGSSGQGFSDPEEFAWSTHARGEELVVAEPGEFRTDILSIRLPRVLLRQRSETLARISRVTTPANLAEIVFRVAPGAPARCAGVPFELGQVVLHAPGSSYYQRVDGAARWGTATIRPDYLACAARTLIGADLEPPPGGRIIADADPTSHARLLTLHDRILRLAAGPLATAARIRAWDAEFVQALLACLVPEAVRPPCGLRQRRERIMDRFEAFITGQPDQSPTLEEVCAAVGVPGRTLRACCTEFLGISPKRYLLLRRLKLVRRALRQADPRATVTVTKVALKYGFSEFGRFAGQYRAQFGDSPSVTLREPPGRIVVPMSSRRSTGSPEPAAETA